VILLALPATTLAQQRNYEIGAGYAYINGNGGLSGFNANIAVFFNRRVAFAFDYDGGYDTSSLGTFQVTPIGNVTAKNHLQDLLLGPRVYFPGLIKSKNKTINLLNPFGEVQLGGSQLNSEIIQSATNTRTGTSDSAFTWMIGGGADVRLSPHWAARGKLDLLRTHLGDTGQSRVRFVLGVAYFFRPR
jgi:hypothetical protein